MASGSSFYNLSFANFANFLPGGFWFAFAATMIPAFNAAGKTFLLFPFNQGSLSNGLQAPYSSSTTSTGAGLASEGFMNTYGEPMTRLS